MLVDQARREGGMGEFLPSSSFFRVLLNFFKLKKQLKIRIDEKKENNFNNFIL